ncbi:MAG TPA: sensor histidine kinase [Bacilli bacterium]|nr:sensor histidine kinase [Bacilli bacterium]
MSNKSKGTFQSVRWPLLFAFVRTTAAALVVFVGLVWVMLALWSAWTGDPLWGEASWIGAKHGGASVVILLLSGLVTTVVVGGYAGLGESRSLSRRVEALGDAAVLWANGRLGHRIVGQGGEDELSELADSLNSMAERLEEQVIALQRLIEKNEQLTQQAAGLAALEERSRLARDLHDSVSQQLFALGMTAGAAAKLVTSAPERATPLVLQTEQMAAKAQAEMRALLLHLRPVELEGRSLVEALERFLHDVCPRQGVTYDLEVDGVTRLREGMEAQLFRITQEAVSNVIRHASAKRLLVSLTQSAERVVLSIRDDGQGFDPQTLRDGSYGLKSLRERAEEMGGRLDVRSRPGDGADVRVVVSLVGNGEEATRGEHDTNSVGG